MHTQSDDVSAHFNIGDIVKAVGKPGVLKIVECREGVSHVHIETAKMVYYKCEWRHPNGNTYSEWYNANKLEKAW